MSRLPNPGGDEGQWGDILNDYLSQAHKADGTLKTDSVSAAQLASGSVKSAAIADGAITTTKLADGSVTSIQLDDTTKASLAKADTSLQVEDLNAMYSARSLVITDIDVDTIPDGNPTDNIAAYYNAGTSTIIVAGVSLAVSSYAVWIWVSNAWVQPLASSTVDTTPPTAGTLSVATDSTTASATISGALAGGTNILDGAPYRFGFALTSTASGWSDAEWEALAQWSSWQSSTTYSGWSNLIPETSYMWRHQVRDQAGKTKIGGTITKSTTVLMSWITRAQYLPSGSGSTLPTGSPTGTALTSLSATYLVTDTAGTPDQWVFSALSSTVVGYKFAASMASKIRVTVDYSIIPDAAGNWPNCQIQIWTNSALNNYLTAGVDSAKTAQAAFSDNAAGTWTMATVGSPTIPQTGTLQVIYDAPNKAGEVWVAGVKVATFAAAPADTALPAYGLGFTMGNKTTRVSRFKVEEYTAA